ncbi:MAG TPA: AAA family ATPase, partial [Sphingomicrobium sp.]|nr:AAA family ATPase [Sphingomicrobium sp.]
MNDIANANPGSRAETVMAAPDRMVKVRDLFGVDSDMEVPAFSEADERVPDLDPTYVFDRNTTLAICAGFARNRRVMVQGYHGTGKSTHIEQVAARLNWPMIRINLDAHISRIDLVGRDAIVLREGQQVTEFREGLLPWALQHPVALVFDANTTLAICAGFGRNRRVMVQGYHGTGKSTHIEQIAARLNWPMIRINLDAHISRIDLVGRDAIVLRE